MTEFFRDFFQSVSDRLRNRVFGPFLLAFLFWNWRPILLILASNKPIEQVIRHIEVVGYFNIWNILVYPLSISILYSISQPFINHFLGKLIRWPLKKGIESTYELKKERKKGELKLADLEFEIQEAKAGTVKYEELNNKIKSLEEQNELISTDNKKLRDSEIKLKSQTINYQNRLTDYSSSYSKYILDLMQSRYPDNEKWELVKALELLDRGDVDLDVISNEVKNDLNYFKIVETQREIGTDKRAYFLTDFGKLFISDLNLKLNDNR
ncbi:hypothetical protein [Algoriphagus formosus]|uniref:hypothetical protein n=1 Tax=Algoriphagus formosus TaxID=2007308 RepID=UPI000C292C34|nr:hypothetical protein [Algoriphagus formosus]